MKVYQAYKRSETDDTVYALISTEVFDEDDVQFAILRKWDGQKLGAYRMFLLFVWEQEMIHVGEAHVRPYQSDVENGENTILDVLLKGLGDNIVTVTHTKAGKKVQFEGTLPLTEIAHQLL
jgi:hypothetical protein